MTEFLTTTGISERIERIIREADDWLIIISPYLSLNPRIQDYIQSKCLEHEFKVREHPVQVVIIYRDEKQTPEIDSWLESLPNALIGFCENLHAKCYLNEKEALITSMNLYDYSQIHNYEMGMVISQETQPQVYSQIYDEVIQIRRAMTEMYDPEDWYDQEQDEPESGFCIRCGGTILLNLAKPYCDDCFKIWNQYKNYTYMEKQCHLCGKEHKSYMDRPFCVSCYGKYRNMFRAMSYLAMNDNQTTNGTTD